jgi:hypothetical protein
MASDVQRNVIFVLSGDASVYSSVSRVAELRVRKTCLSVSIDCNNLVFKQVTSDQLTIDEAMQAFLIVSLGTNASNFASQLPLSGNLLNAMLPYRQEGLGTSAARTPDEEIYIDQPYSRYFDLIKLTIPRVARVGLLIHESNDALVHEIENIAAGRGLMLVPSFVNEERDVGEALSYLLSDIDVLLALPDARIHNSNTISHILTTAYRNNIPVIGFSSAYVKAGATAAVYTSPENIAHQISDSIIDYVIYSRFKERIQRASYFSIIFNFEVARSLGLPPISPSEIKKAIAKGID